MSNEPNGHGIDPLVSDTYRQLAEERTPEALNREVLRMAASEVRSRYAIARAWTRPLAWAATIALSLVLVLQLADLPEPVVSSPEPPDVARPDRDSVDTLDAATPEPAVPVSQPVSMPPEQGRRGATDEELAAAAPEKRSRSGMQQQDQKVRVLNDAPVTAPQTAAAETMAQEELPTRSDLARDTVQGAREKARTQEAPEQERQEEVAKSRRLSGEQVATAETSAARSMSSFAVTAAADDIELLCPESVRETAKEWLECIVAFEETAPPELVDREYQALHERFPELGAVSR